MQITALRFVMTLMIALGLGLALISAALLEAAPGAPGLKIFSSLGLLAAPLLMMFGAYGHFVISMIIPRR